jgi:ribosome-binding protein aMBF1 (putative translation factor)
MEHQNWEPHVLHKTAAQRAALSTQKTIQPRKSTEAQRLAKLENEEYVKPKMLSSESRQQLVQARLALKLTQQQLDQKCSFPPHTINHLESNKRTPSTRELMILNSVLKCGLKLA